MSLLALQPFDEPEGALVCPVVGAISSKSDERYCSPLDETNFSNVHLYQCTFSFKIRCLSAWRSMFLPFRDVPLS